jgi:hypothetical protein
MAEPSTSELPIQYRCAFCKTHHDSRPAGSIRSFVWFCAAGLEHYQRLGIIKLERNGDPPSFRLTGTRPYSD